MNANQIGKQISGIVGSPGVVAATIAGGGIGLVGGAMIAGQQAEEAGSPLSQQATASFRGGVSAGMTGTAIGFGGSVALSAAKSILGKK